MPTRIVTVGSTSGLHSRPATIVSRAAQAAAYPVLVSRVGENGVDAASILLLLSQGFRAGDTVQLTSDDEAGLSTVADLVAANLDD